MCLPPSVLAWVWRGRFVGVHLHVALSATRGKASPSLKEVFFQPCFLAASKEFFQPCLLADFKEQMFLCFFLLQMPINRQATYQITSFQSQVFFCNPIEREPRELKRGEKNRE